LAWFVAACNCGLMYVYIRVDQQLSASFKVVFTQTSCKRISQLISWWIEFDDSFQAGFLLLHQSQCNPICFVIGFYFQISTVEIRMKVAAHYISIVQFDSKKKEFRVFVMYLQIYLSWLKKIRTYLLLEWHAFFANSGMQQVQFILAHFPIVLSRFLATARCTIPFVNFTKLLSQ